MYYNYPDRNLRVIGITGTNGKTTITYLIAQWMYLINEKTAIISTIGNGIYNHKILTSKNTTDSAIDIQKFLHYFLKKKVKNVVMEVSSHGLIQHRVLSLNFLAAVFSNLTHEHLDYHKNIKNYEAAKWLLFSRHTVQHKIINADDEIGRKWLKKIPEAVSVYINKQLNPILNKRFLTVLSIKIKKNSTDINFNSSWGPGTIKSKLFGTFNITNIVLALTTLLVIGFPLKKLLIYTKQLKLPLGRMQKFQLLNKPTVIVDYAHNPKALEKVLKNLKDICKGKIWCVFGCGGERDKEKRAIMGIIAEKFSDKIIITDDNPRREKSIDIVNDIISEIKIFKKISIIFDRKNAIKYAIFSAKKEDIILIAGKGHENYQIINNKYVDYSDLIIVQNILGIKQ